MGGVSHCKARAWTTPMPSPPACALTCLAGPRPGKSVVKTFTSKV